MGFSAAVNIEVEQSHSLKWSHFRSVFVSLFLFACVATRPTVQDTHTQDILIHSRSNISESAVCRSLSRIIAYGNGRGAPAHRSVLIVWCGVRPPVKRYQMDRQWNGGTIRGLPESVQVSRSDAEESGVGYFNENLNFNISSLAHREGSAKDLSAEKICFLSFTSSHLGMGTHTHRA